MRKVRAKRTKTRSPLCKVFGLAYFAGVSALVAAFKSTNMGSDSVHLFLPARETRSRRLGNRERQMTGSQGVRLTTMVSATLTQASRGKFNKKMKLAQGGTTRASATDERLLLKKIQRAKILLDTRNHVGSDDGSDVPVDVWACAAGIDVKSLQRSLEEGAAAKRELVNLYMPTVKKIVNQRYRWRLSSGLLSAADLVQEGAYALGVAADRFEPSMPNQFITYAMFVIRDKLDTALASGSTGLSVPSAALKELYTARRELTMELGRTPSQSEVEMFFLDGLVDGIDGEMDIEIRGHDRKRQSTEDSRDIPDRPLRWRKSLPPRVRQRRLALLNAVHRVTSLDTQVVDGAGNSVALVETIAGDNRGPLAREGADELYKLVPKVLTSREIELLHMACGLGGGEPRSMVEISHIMCMSVTRTKAIFETSLAKLRAATTLEVEV